MPAGTKVDVAVPETGVAVKETAVEVEISAGVGATGEPGVTVGKSGTGVGLELGSVESA